MDKYCIIRVAKVKGSSALHTNYRHNYRIDEVVNADPSKLNSNDELVSLNGLDYQAAYLDMVNEMKKSGAKQTIRSNAVHALDVVCSFSRDMLGEFDLDEWKEAVVEFLNDKFNPKEIITDSGEKIVPHNVVSVMYHADEIVPHIHACIIPIDNRGHLNASYYIDGKKDLSELQTSFARKMEKFGLQRGNQWSIAKHNDVKRFYNAINKINAEQLPVPEIDESVEDYRTRASVAYNEKLLELLNKEYQYKKQITNAISEARASNVELNKREQFIDELKDELEVSSEEEILREIRRLKKIEREKAQIELAKEKMLEISDPELQEKVLLYIQLQEEMVRLYTEFSKEEKARAAR